MATGTRGENTPLTKTDTALERNKTAKAKNTKPAVLLPTLQPTKPRSLAFVPIKDSKRLSRKI